MLSVLMQCTTIAAVVMVIWVLWGYSFAFGGSTSPYWGGTGKLFLAGVTPESTAATFTDGVVMPEYIFICFQMTFACITPALIVGAFAERIKFSRRDAVRHPVGHLRLLPDRAHGLGRSRPLFNLGATRLRRRHGRPHQRRHRGLVGASWSASASATARTTWPRTP
jgi:hypothetical protein